MSKPRVHSPALSTRPAARMRRSAAILSCAAIALLGLATIAQSAGNDQTDAADGASASAERVHVAQTDETAPSLPGGASSLQETYQDWQVGCALSDGAKVCSMSQEQRNVQTQQRVLAAGLVVEGPGLGGALVLPFGLQLDSGVSLQVDDAAPLGTKSFSTCLPGGCVVPLTFDAALVETLAASAALKIAAKADGSGEDVALEVSLKGFSQAWKRLAELAL